MLVIVGLGNPGKQYENTKHNIGFQVVGKLADKFNITGKNQPKFKAIIGNGNILGVDTIIVEPLTFMNLSGISILTILNWYKLDLSNLIVVYDDLSIKLGKIRFRPDGSDGGHNGIKSIIEQMGGRTEFNRLRVGIGPEPTGEDRVNFVLKPFHPDRQKLATEAVNIACEALEFYIKNGILDAMNKYNGIDIDPAAAKPRKANKIIIDTSKSNIEKKGLLTEPLTNNNIDNTIFPIDLMEVKKGYQSG